MRDCLCITTPIAFSSFTVYCLLFEVGEAVVETQISLTLKSDVRQVRAVVVARVLRVFSVRQFVDGRHAGWGGRLSQVRVEVVGQLRQTVVLQWKFMNNVITVLYFLVLHNHSRTKQSSLRCTCTSWSQMNMCQDHIIMYTYNIPGKCSWTFTLEP